MRVNCAKDYTQLFNYFKDMTDSLSFQTIILMLSFWFRKHSLISLFTLDTWYVKETLFPFSWESF